MVNGLLSTLERLVRRGRQFRLLTMSLIPANTSHHEGYAELLFLIVDESIRVRIQEK